MMIMEMAGWLESRRKRVEGNDWAIIGLGGDVYRDVIIDTRHFTGNYPPAASLDFSSNQL